MKTELKQQAVALRMDGLSYREIMERVPIAKSTLSDWLHSVGLSTSQKQRLTEKKLAAIKSGHKKWHEMRLERDDNTRNEAREIIQRLVIDKTHLFVAGLMLYWAEGSKGKGRKTGGRVCFSNMDPKMINLFLEWLRMIVGALEEDIMLSIYIHTTADAENAKMWWAQVTGCDPSRFHLYFKRHSQKTNRKNIDLGYHGLVRVEVRRSTNLMRKIAFLTEYLCEHWGVV